MHPIYYVLIPSQLMLQFKHAENYAKISTDKDDAKVLYQILPSLILLLPHTTVCKQTDFYVV